MGWPVYKRPRREKRPMRRTSPCGKVAHGSEETAAHHIAALIADGAHQPRKGRLHHYRCPDCGAIHVGHTGRPLA